MFKTFFKFSWKVFSQAAIHILPLGALYCIAKALPPQKGRLSVRRRIYVDVSSIYRHDAKTGIQRVVRALLTSLRASPPKGYDVVPVYGSSMSPYRCAPSFLKDDEAVPSADVISDDLVEVKKGDVFLGLDFSAHLIAPRYLELARWRNSGVSINFILYDLLPLHKPEWFNLPSVKAYRRWIKCVTVLSDQIFCISGSIKAEYLEWARTNGVVAPPVQVIPMGADIETSQPTSGLSPEDRKIIKLAKEAPSVLMVGTVEPRKGYDQALDAFEILWAHNKDIRLIIIGKPGWKTEELQQRIKEHAENGHHLFWLSGASDELLTELYSSVNGLLAASYGEGFGLPLIEAIRHGTPVLARKIPIFLEISAQFGGITHGNFLSASALAQEIEIWLSMARGIIVNQQMSWNKSLDTILFHCVKP